MAVNISSNEARTCWPDIVIQGVIVVLFLHTSDGQQTKITGHDVVVDAKNNTRYN